MVDLKKKASALPYKPGVYIMKNKNGEVIYVGKAKALKNRVLQYFRSPSGHSIKTRRMVQNVHDFDVIVTDTEFEALVLECSLIKQYSPKYNILLKDDKGYPYIKLSSGDEYPRMSIVSKPQNDGHTYFGPYSGRISAKSAITAISQALMLPTCRRRFPQDIGKERPCLNHHLGRCMAPCSGKISREEYGKVIDEAAMLLSGKMEGLLNHFEKEMQAASENLEFEKAAFLRDRIRDVKKLGQRQKIALSAFFDTDVIAFAGGETGGCVAVLHYISGKLHDKEIKMFPDVSEEDAKEAISGFIKQYYLKRNTAPREIIISHPIEDGDATEEWLKGLSGHKVEIINPKRGEKLSLLKMAAANAKDELERSASKEEKESKLMELVATRLNLSAPPKRIEAYDISNTSGSDIVASMVVLEKGRPQKSAYRRFKIKTLDGQNDFASMEEVIKRRLQNFADGDKKFMPLADMMLIDGGKGQVSSALAAAKSVIPDLDVPIFGMVKDDKHRTRALVDIYGREIGIDTNVSLFSFFGRIQEEAHRFAVEYHRQRRSKNMGSSSLDEIEGVGLKRRSELLKRFHTIEAIKSASEAELSEVVPKNVARSIIEFYSKKQVEK